MRSNFFLCNFLGGVVYTIKTVVHDVNILYYVYFPISLRFVFFFFKKHLFLRPRNFLTRDPEFHSHYPVVHEIVFISAMITRSQDTALYISLSPTSLLISLGPVPRREIT